MAVRHEILPLRAQADVQDEWLKRRLDRFIPQLLAREKIDMWLVICREYNEDPVLISMLPATAMSARRRTILVFARDESGAVERLTLSRYGYEGLYDAAWDPDKETQHACLSRIIRERDPQRLGINMSETFAFGDGLSLTEYRLLKDAIGDYQSRLVSAEGLCVGWLEWRLPEEIVAYWRLAEIGHSIIARAFSSEVIHPSITTTDDVVWWMRQTMQDAGLRPWFQPSIDIQARGVEFAFLGGGERKVIQPGDLLHCDMGFHYLGLATDQQQHGYVLRAGEHDAPGGLREALAIGNRLQDIHLEEMQVGRTGNEVLHAALSRARAEGIRAQIYTHPLGVHGHAAGPVVGLWDKQDRAPGAGDYPLYDDTVYSIELNIARSLPEWDGQDARIMLEEDAALTGGKMQWLDGRQEALRLIG